MENCQHEFHQWGVAKRVAFDAGKESQHILSFSDPSGDSFRLLGVTFNVELTMTSAAALYFQEEFDQPTASAAAIASVFGWMNLFARGLGGFVSDMACAKYGYLATSAA